MPLRYNTARVILQIIKELIRLRGDWLRRLRLAHDLRSAMLGNPLFIRKLLRRILHILLGQRYVTVGAQLTVDTQHRRETNG